MYMKLIDGKAYFGVSFDLESFPKLIQEYRNKNKNTRNIPNIEKQWCTLIAEPIDDFPTVKEFIKDVCKWGGYPGISGRG